MNTQLPVVFMYAASHWHGGVALAYILAFLKCASTVCVLVKYTWVKINRNSTDKRTWQPQPHAPTSVPFAVAQC